MEDKTIFEKIISREIPAKIEYEDDLCIVIHDVSPQAPVHLLIIPKQKIPQISRINPQKAPPLLGHLLAVAPLVASQLGVEEGFRLVINNGLSAGQTIFHLHIHLLAGRSFTWPPG